MVDYPSFKTVHDIESSRLRQDVKEVIDIQKAVFDKTISWAEAASFVTKYYSDWQNTSDKNPTREYMTYLKAKMDDCKKQAGEGERKARETSREYETALVYSMNLERALVMEVKEGMREKAKSVRISDISIRKSGNLDQTPTVHNPQDVSIIGRSVASAFSPRASLTSSGYPDGLFDPSGGRRSLARQSSPIFPLLPPPPPHSSPVLPLPP